MKLIFEDNSSAPFHILYQYPYKENLEDFIYTNGNGKIASCVKEILENSNENILVFLDLVPDNRDLCVVYRQLKALSIEYSYRVIVIPIVSGEYQFIRTVDPILLNTSSEIVNACIHKLPFTKTGIIQTEEDEKYITNFERFCKIVLDRSSSCISTVKEGNLEYLKYYTYNCKCDQYKPFCEELSLLEKADKFIKEYKCWFYKDNLQIDERILVGDLWELHRQQVDAFNKWSDTYKLTDTRKNIKYAHIHYIK